MFIPSLTSLLALERASSITYFIVRLMAVIKGIKIRFYACASARGN